MPLGDPSLSPLTETITFTLQNTQGKHLGQDFKAILWSVVRASLGYIRPGFKREKDAQAAFDLLELFITEKNILATFTGLSQHDP